MIDSVEYNAPIQFHVEQQSTKNAKAIVVPKLIIVLLINLSSVSIQSDSSYLYSFIDVISFSIFV